MHLLDPRATRVHVARGRILKSPETLGSRWIHTFLQLSNQTLFKRPAVSGLADVNKVSHLLTLGSVSSSSGPDLIP